jgi:hypothetical protein
MSLHMSDHDPLQSIWKNQSQEEFTMSLADIHARADNFQVRVRQRNWIEYAAAVLVIGVFVWMALLIPAPVVKAGALLIALGAAYVCWRLNEVGRAASKAERDAAQNLTAFHRAELVRQRDALKTVWRWYLAPFVPGVLVFLAGVSFAPELEAPLAAKIVTFVTGLAFQAAVFAAVWWLNAMGVKRLEKEIAALDAVS